MDIVGYTSTGEPVYEAMPEGWDTDWVAERDEMRRLEAEWYDGIGWSDCRI